MTPITRRDVIAHQSIVPWPNLRQVEQDLLLCRAMVALFDDQALRQQIAMRGGTLLHKVHLAPASRYSEDIDLVAIGADSEEHIAKALRRVLAVPLGRPVQSLWENVRLAVRNVIRPSRVLRLSYRVKSVSDAAGPPLDIREKSVSDAAGPPLDIVIEVNVTERTPHRPITQHPFVYPFRGIEQGTSINGFEIHEMLGTKMRALFQRRRGRDLFDLFWALKRASVPVNPQEIIHSFQHYMEREGTTAKREEFVSILRGHLMDRGFLSDMIPLLRTGIDYEPIKAGQEVIDQLLAWIPE